MSPWLKVIAVSALSVLLAAVLSAYARLTYLLLVVPDRAFNRLIGVKTIPDT